VAGSAKVLTLIRGGPVTGAVGVRNLGIALILFTFLHEGLALARTVEAQRSERHAASAEWSEVTNLPIGSLLRVRLSDKILDGCHLLTVDPTELRLACPSAPNRILTREDVLEVAVYRRSVDRTALAVTALVLGTGYVIAATGDVGRSRGLFVSAGSVSLLAGGLLLRQSRRPVIVYRR
jgi:hypothetical protein